MTDPNGRRAEPLQEAFSRPAGVLTVRREPNKLGKPEFVPAGFVSADKSASLTFVDNHPRIRLREEGGYLVLTERGFYRGNAQEFKTLQAYTDVSIASIASSLSKDGKLQHSLLSLANGLFEVSLEYASSSGIQPHPAAKRHLRAATSARSNFAKRPSGLQCTITAFSKTVETQVYGWRDQVVTALERGLACASNCEQRPFFEVLPCLAVCAAKTFSDIWTRTWTFIETVYTTVITYVVHCSLQAGSFPSYNGSLVLPNPTTILPAGGKAADADPVLKPFDKLLRCFAGAKWSVGDLGDFGLSIPGIRDIPVTVRVCMGRECATVVKDQFSTLAIEDLAENLPALLTSGSAAKWIEENPNLAGLVSMVAAAIGVAVADVIGFILVALYVLAVHALAIAGQIHLLDFFDAAPKGICLNYPVFPVALVGIINPVAGAVLAANTLVIVTGQS